MSQTTEQRLKNCYERFLKWAEEKSHEYEELNELFQNMLQTSNFTIFRTFIKFNKDFEPVKNICKQADEQKVYEEIREYVNKKIQEMNIEEEIKDKDMMRLIKYLTVFGTIANE